MILVEKNNKDCPRFCLAAHLMYENVPVETIEIKIK